MRNKAFSLVELSIVLVIISIALGMVLSFSTNKTDADKIAETKAKMERIDKAIQSYLINNMAIPCPANPTLSMTNANFGVSVRGVNNYQCVAPLSSGTMKWGMVPVRTLNLSDEYSYDAWGRRFSYVMIEQCNCNSNETGCDTINFNSTDNCGSGANAINIIPTNGSGTSIMNNAILVIISHGKNGHGAYSKAGSATRIVSKLGNISTDEQDNAHLNMAGVDLAVDRNFVARNQVFNDNPLVNFDDIVLYRNKMQLINSVRGLLSNSDNVCNFKDVAGFAASICGDMTRPECTTIMQNMINNLWCYN